MILLKEQPGMQFYLAMAVMAAATVIMIRDNSVSTE